MAKTIGAFEAKTHFSQLIEKAQHGEDFIITNVSYDAAYLELAKRKNATLCTLDAGLQAAAIKYGVAILK
jgi:predicted nucleic acid-binding protein